MDKSENDKQVHCGRWKQRSDHHEAQCIERASQPNNLKLCLSMHVDGRNFCRYVILNSTKMIHIKFTALFNHRMIRVM